MRSYCDVCIQLGRRAETKVEVQRVALCHEHDLDVKEGKINGQLWHETRAAVWRALGLLRESAAEPVQ